MWESKPVVGEHSGDASIGLNPVRDFTIKIQMKTKKLIKNARTFDNKILEVKDVLNDPKSVYLKGLAEGVSTLELISTDEEKEELSVYIMRQQTPVNNIKFLKETTIDMVDF